MHFCTQCKRPYKAYRSVCGSCHEWGTIKKSATLPEGVVSLGQDKGTPIKRYSTGVPRIDTVLGGGLVKGSFTLLGGEPGVGKSTLLLQICEGVRTANPNWNLLYVNAEEAVDKIQDRALRLKIPKDPQIYLGEKQDLHDIVDIIWKMAPHMVILDSLQTIGSRDIDSPTGTLAQMRYVAMKLSAFAKKTQTIVWVVSHVTKEGDISGPKAVEHLVDTTLLFHQGQGSERILMSEKNRFGSTLEIASFQMTEKGLQ